jgi:hypothetical protein
VSRKVRVGLLAFIAFTVVTIGLGLAGVLDEDEEVEREQRAAPTAEDKCKTAGCLADLQDRREGETAERQELPPHSVNIDGCQPAPRPLIERVERQLAGDAVAIRLAYVTDDEQGRMLLGASIYADDGNRVSSGDTWIVSGAEIYALSGSANQYSRFPDGRGDLPDNPSPGFVEAQQLQDDCTIPAISAGR